MNIKNSLTGEGTISSPHSPSLPGGLWISWADNGDGTATVTLTDQATRQAKSDAVKAANALNVGSAWSDVVGVFGGDPLVPAIKKWLAKGTDSDGPVKKAWSEFTDAVPQGFVVSHGAALWRATVETSAEPSTTSGDWTQIFEV